jgi:hypothetical protein
VRSRPNTGVARPMRVLGAALVVIGLLGLLLGGIPYRHRENVAQIGGLKMQVSEQRRANLPGVVWGFAILVGTAIWFSGRKRGA